MENDKLHKIRHSFSHVMAQAVKELFGPVKLGIGPATETGFYYDFDCEHRFVPEDLPLIEKKMKHITAQAQKFESREIERSKALEYFSSLGENYKVELIKDLPETEKITIYKNGNFEDLCKGPHVEHTGQLKHFKLMSIAGAYWRGSEKNPMLQRIYGVAFETKEELDEYLKRMEEAEKRDHRKVGRQLDLFSVSETVGPGLILWHPKGARIRHEIENYWKNEHFKGGYELIYTPHIGRANLWQTSGHLDFYKDSMYSPMDIDQIQYYVKPMNCPFHIQVYKSASRSYRDLPLRWAELGTVYRFEKAGVLHGLLRVRGFTQDDAHIICSPEQVEEETLRVLRFSLNIWKTFGFSEIKAYIATRPNDAVGDPSRWEEAQKSLMKAVEKEGLPYEKDEGGGAFYGPKIDLKIKDAIGREWQTTTIQFDFNLPERFDMEYTGSDGKKHRPYMIHRALLGSLERFFGVLTEHYAGNFPLWLAPVQVRILNITSNEEDYAISLKDKLLSEGIRAEADISNDTINAKIRNASSQKIPYLIVAGKKEKESGNISLRLKGNKNIFGVNTQEFISSIKKEIETKSLEPIYK
ncbi:MAG: threonine--tRNA ligase [Elusimicrobia bacterium]|nr:threonine--tRNA ligase [Elusimicrobiota bacterium]